jgi:chemotaxis protein methyltransferase CheR
MNDQDYAKLSVKIKKLYGLDLANYKAQQMTRRLDAFVSARRESVADFCQQLDKDPALVAKLKDFITINVSEFYRDDRQFKSLIKDVLPKLLENSDALNVWSAGCSHGGEAYSIAMELEKLAPGKPHRILATDIDSTILSRASAGGPYCDADVRNVDPLTLSRFFEKRDGEFWISKDITKRVTFRKHNLLSDPSETGFDLIVCRNVVIYFTDNAKELINRGFIRSLKEEGVLFIGGTETLLKAAELGFDRMLPSFYTKPVTDNRISARLSRAS